VPRCFNPFVNVYRADGNAGAVSIADIMIYRYICPMNPKFLRRFHFAPNIVAIMLVILVQFLGKLRIYRHILPTNAEIP
jgi:hypothetical protein